MKIIATSFILVFCFLQAHAQNWSKDEKQITRIMDKAVVEVDKRNNNRVVIVPPGAVWDSSTTIAKEIVGVSINGEYMDYDAKYRPSNSQYSNFATKNYVTVREYEEFMKYVLDSMAREELFFKLMLDEEAGIYLNFEEYYFDENELEYVNTDLSKRKKIRDVFSLNEFEQIDMYDGINETVHLNHFFVPRHERLNGVRKLDDRKLSYHYYTINMNGAYYPKLDSFPSTQSGAIRIHQERYRFIINHSIPVYVDDWKWAEKAEHNFDEYAVLSQTYRTTEKDRPIVGITGVQAEAFCNWKEEQINKRWRDEDEIFRAFVTLPIQEELNHVLNTPSWTVDQYDYTDQWSITREEYMEFYRYSRDSLLYEYLYNNLQDQETAAELLKYNSIYFDEPSQEFREFDPADRYVNREHFPLNLNSKKVKKNVEVKKLTKEFEKMLEGRVVYFQYSFLDVTRKRQLGDLEGERIDSLGKTIYQSIAYKCGGSDPIEQWDCYGKDLILDRVDFRGKGAGVRAHKELAQFIVTEKAAIEPLGALTKENRQDLINTEISYAQALAFYHWKYPISKATEKNTLSEYVFPSEQEYRVLQSGKRVVKPLTELQTPTPSFRYVVHLD